MLNRNIQSISNSRLSPYLKICDGNTIDAMCVYTSLQHRAALYFTVSGLLLIQVVQKYLYMNTL